MLTYVFKALGDPTRRRILELLCDRDLTPTEILRELNITQPTLSHHLDILKRANLVTSEREGQFIRYSLNMGVLEMALKYIMGFLSRREDGK
ncbi:winged helix-turn-helix transcriptional regulator [candidate division WOR-3 bacterium]|nr:winged helix-turn-helix transcriptional regulator [candidate division WOR-3 bacterium]